MVSFGGAGACGCSLHAIALAEQQKKSLTLPKDLLHLEAAAAAAADTILGGGKAAAWLYYRSENHYLLSAESWDTCCIHA